MTSRPRRTAAEIERARRKSVAARRHHLRTKHGMTLEQYEALKAYQSGTCYLCRRATGASRALAVDHDHEKARTVCGHDHKNSCEECWRGLLCSHCNEMLAIARDERDFFVRAARYLADPPAQRWLRMLKRRAA